MLAIAVALVPQSGLTLCDPVDCSPPGFSVHGILQARILEWIAILGFSRQEYWSGLPFPSPGDLPNLGIESRSPALQADSLLSELQGTHVMLATIEDI